MVKFHFLLVLYGRKVTRFGAARLEDLVLTQLNMQRFTTSEL